MLYQFSDLASILWTVTIAYTLCVPAITTQNISHPRAPSLTTHLA